MSYYIPDMLKISDKSILTWDARKNNGKKIVNIHGKSYIYPENIIESVKKELNDLDDLNKIITLSYIDSDNQTISINFDLLDSDHCFAIPSINKFGNTQKFFEYVNLLYENSKNSVNVYVDNSIVSNEYLFFKNKLDSYIKKLQKYQNEKLSSNTLNQIKNEINTLMKLYEMNYNGLEIKMNKNLDKYYFYIFLNFKELYYNTYQCCSCDYYSYFDGFSEDNVAITPNKRNKLIDCVTNLFAKNFNYNFVYIQSKKEFIKFMFQYKNIIFPKLYDLDYEKLMGSIYVDVLYDFFIMQSGLESIKKDALHFYFDDKLPTNIIDILNNKEIDVDEFTTKLKDYLNTDFIIKNDDDHILDCIDYIMDIDPTNEELDVLMDFLKTVLNNKSSLINFSNYNYANDTANDKERKNLLKNKIESIKNNKNNAKFDIYIHYIKQLKQHGKMIKDRMFFCDLIDAGDNHSINNLIDYYGGLYIFKKMLNNNEIMKRFIAEAYVTYTVDSDDFKNDKLKFFITNIVKKFNLVVSKVCTKPFISLGRDYNYNTIMNLKTHLLRYLYPKNSVIQRDSFDIQNFDLESVKSFNWDKILYKTRIMKQVDLNSFVQSIIFNTVDGYLYIKDNQSTRHCIASDDYKKNAGVTVAIKSNNDKYIHLLCTPSKNTNQFNLEHSFCDLEQGINSTNLESSIILSQGQIDSLKLRDRFLGFEPNLPEDNNTNTYRYFLNKQNFNYNYFQNGVYLLYSGIPLMIKSLTYSIPELEKLEFELIENGVINKDQIEKNKYEYDYFSL